MKLYWNSSSIGNQTIPSSYFYKKEYISGNSFDVYLQCPTYYEGDNEEHSNVCYEICGDGTRIGDVSFICFIVFSYRRYAMTKTIIQETGAQILVD